MNSTRRTIFKSMLAAGTLPLFGIGNAGFGEGRVRQFAKGAKVRINAHARHGYRKGWEIA